MYTTGAGLARGYLNRPSLTAEKFIPDPFTAEAGGRMYRTGDVARFLADGRIEYLGRADHQVKVRGFRIELGEIEAALHAHAWVRDAMVTAREEVGGGGKRLVAYVVSKDGAALTPAELRQSLKGRLPEYMVPSQFVVLDEMPLTPNGKVDRKRLPEPEPVGAGLSGAYVAPRGAVEEAVAGVWAEVLGVERVGAEDNFFELGGHSLLATQVISRVRAAFGVELPLRSLFEAPTVRGLAARVEAGAGRHLSSLPPLSAGERDGELPLSFTQQRLWFLDQLEPGSAFYNIAAAARLVGELDASALAESLREVARRHEALRTRFVTSGGSPVQVIDPSPNLPLPVLDLSRLPEGQREAEFEGLAREEARRPFDLARGPLLRTSLVRLGEREHVLLVTMHHIVSDGWSVGVLMREVAALYDAFSRGEESPLAELPIQYADFARWQRECVRGELLETQLSYWKRQLEGAPAVLELPADHSRPAVQTYEGARQSLQLPEALSAAIKNLGRKEGHTLFVTLLTSFVALLHRYTGQQDIVVGSPVSGRNRLETEELVGFFVNTLALRANLGGGPTFAELAGRVRDAVLEAHAHQDVPFEKVVEALQVERDLSRSPLFQVMFVLKNASADEQKVSGLALAPLEIDNGTAKFDLTLYVEETARGLLGTFEYNTSLFEPRTIARMLAHFHTLLESVVADEHHRVSELPLLDGAERRQILTDWNQTEQPYDRHACLHQLFERQAVLTPDATALVGGTHRLSYDELNRQANSLARRLRALGVGAESRVGVMLPRTSRMLVSLLAVLKAGGAYVPLDPAYPQERLAFMLADADVRVLLTESSFLATVPEGAAQVICLDSDVDVDDIPSANEENPASVTLPENLAYVIYTSGSTGVPKGVAIAHRSAVAFLDWARGFFTEDELSSVLAATSINFDLSVFELFAPLAVGGTVLLADNALALPALDYAGEVKLINTVPSAMAELVRQGAVPSSVMTVNLAGEALPRRLVQAIYESSAVAKVVNLYGPSEDTTYTTWEVVADEAGAPVLIGRPVANTRIYILDGSLQPAPVGVAGELYTTGAGLARGYLNRPSLTAEKFIPDPFSAEAGGRMYRTGDVARFLADGRIEYLGRADHQVKVRGFRIELGEIEAALERYEGVERAVVMVKEAEGGDKRLVAYVVAKDGREVTASELRGTLKAGLPEYMVPQAFVLLDELPLTPNGKVDRKRLPEPEAARPELGASYAPPETATEEAVARVWADVLGLEAVGRNDNFFELGGHSLMATQVMFALREALDVELPLRSIFEAPTVSELSQAIDAARGNGQGERLGAITRRSRERHRAKASAPQLATVPEVLREITDV
ncbi:MAG TPA: amino acid adenylation domain-containing protein [Pyrinomonadaceae bacterium]